MCVCVCVCVWVGVVLHLPPPPQSYPTCTPPGIGVCVCAREMVILALVVKPDNLFYLTGRGAPLNPLWHGGVLNRAKLSRVPVPAIYHLGNYNLHGSIGDKKNKLKKKERERERGL